MVSSFIPPSVQNWYFTGMICGMQSTLAQRISQTRPRRVRQQAARLSAPAPGDPATRSSPARSHRARRCRASANCRTPRAVARHRAQGDRRSGRGRPADPAPWRRHVRRRAHRQVVFAADRIHRRSARARPEAARRISRTRRRRSHAGRSDGAESFSGRARGPPAPPAFCGGQAAGARADRGAASGDWRSATRSNFALRRARTDRLPADARAAAPACGRCRRERRRCCWICRPAVLRLRSSAARFSTTAASSSSPLRCIAATPTISSPNCTANSSFRRISASNRFLDCFT